MARPHAFGESAIREVMPEARVDAIDRLDKAGRRQALRVLGRAAESSGFPAACEAEERIFGDGRIPTRRPATYSRGASPRGARRMGRGPT